MQGATLSRGQLVSQRMKLGERSAGVGYGEDEMVEQLAINSRKDCFTVKRSTKRMEHKYSGSEGG